MCFRPASVQKPKKCPQCGGINPSAASFCIKCKTPLSELEPELFQCPRCGHDNPRTVTVCEECGLTQEMIVASLSPVRCPECKYPNKPLADECQRCGAKLPKPWDGVINILQKEGI